MKKLSNCLLTALVIAIVLKVTGAVLLGVRNTSGNFNMVPLANSLVDIGMIAIALTGIALLVVVIVNTIRPTAEK